VLVAGSFNGFPFIIAAREKGPSAGTDERAHRGSGRSRASGEKGLAMMWP